MSHRRCLLLLALVLACAAPALAQTDPKQQLNEQLYEAARRGDAAEVRALLDKGADANAKFRYGATALFKAAERGHTEVIRALLERGADATVRDTFYGAKAMTWALDKGHVGAVRALLTKDAESAGEVLMTGVRGGNVELAKAAVESGALKPETLTAALAAASSNPERAPLADLLKKAGAQPPPEVSADVLRTYAGKYKGEPGPELTVTFKDGKLFAQPTGQQPIALMATDQTNFRPTEFDGITLTFQLDAGKVTGIALKQGANTTQLKRVEQ